MSEDTAGSDRHVVSEAYVTVEQESQQTGSDEYYDERNEPYNPSPGNRLKSQNETAYTDSRYSDLQYDQSVYKSEQMTEPYEKSEYTQNSPTTRSIGGLDDQFGGLNMSQDNQGYNQVSQWVNRDNIASTAGKTSQSSKSVYSQKSDSEASAGKTHPKSAVTNDSVKNVPIKSKSSGKSRGSTERLSMSSKSSEASLIERINKADSTPLVSKFTTRNEAAAYNSGSEDSADDQQGTTPRKNDYSPPEESVKQQQQPQQQANSDLHRTGSDMALSFKHYGSMQSIPEHEPAQSEVYPQSDLYNQSEGYSAEYHPHFKDSGTIISGSAMSGEGHDQKKRRAADSQASSYSLATSSAFIHAVEMGDTTFVRKALDNPNMDPNKTTKFQSRSALHLAAGYGQVKVCEELLYAGVEPACKTSDGRSPLHEAAQGGHGAVLQLLLDYTRDVDAQDQTGKGPCHVAAYHGEEKCLEILVDKGAQLVLKDNSGAQPAHLAAMRNHRNILEYLYDKGIDLSCRDSTGKLPIHFAAQYGALDCLTCLVERECDIALPDNHGNLPIHFAARNDHLDCMRFLIKQGTSLEVVQNEERTAAHVAAAHGSHKVLHWLCEKGCNVSAQDKHLNLPIHLAGTHGKPRCFNCLLQHNSDMTTRNDKNDTPVEAAKKMGHKLLIEKAVRNEVACPVCKQQYEYSEWEEAVAPPPVMRTVTRMASTAFSSPLPKQVVCKQQYEYSEWEEAVAPPPVMRTVTRMASTAFSSPLPKQVEKVKTPIEISAEKRKQSQIKKSQSARGSSNNKSIFTFQKQTDIIGKRLPRRDLSAKYFGNYLPSIE